MSKPMSKSVTELPSGATGALRPRWPKIAPAPATWESGSAAHRLGETPNSLYKPRNLTLSRRRDPGLWSACGGQPPASQNKQTTIVGDLNPWWLRVSWNPPSFPMASRQGLRAPMIGMTNRGSGLRSIPGGAGAVEPSLLLRCRPPGIDRGSRLLLGGHGLSVETPQPPRYRSMPRRRDAPAGRARPSA